MTERKREPASEREQQKRNNDNDRGSDRNGQ